MAFAAKGLPPGGEGSPSFGVSSFGGFDSSDVTPHLPEYQAHILARRDRARLLASFPDGGRRASDASSGVKQLAQRKAPEAGAAPAPAILNFKPFEKNSLKGFFDVELPSGMVLTGCTLHESNGKHWVGLPAKPYSKPDGSQSWVKIVDFRDKAAGARFQQTITPLARAAYEQSQARGAA